MQEMAKPKTLKEWFCIKGERQNFKPNVIRDASVIFCHSKMIIEGARASVERSFAIGEPVKMMIYGDWGVGKTHAVHNVAWWLDNDPETFSTKTVFFELGDITKKTNVGTVVRAVLDNVGLDEIIRLTGNYMAKTEVYLPEGLRGIGVGKDIADAYQKFLSASPGDIPTELVSYALEHLKGGAVREAPSIGLTLQLTESKEFYHVLVCLGHLYEKVDERQLIIIADEGAKLEALAGDEATEAHWVDANKMFFADENTHFGFIYTLSARNFDDFPEVLNAPQIENRLGKGNLIELLNLTGPEVGDYLKKLVSDFVDMEAVKALVDSGEIGADFDENTYPFTPDAFAHFIDFWDRNQRDSKPRDISDRLNDAGFIALKNGKRLIDTDSLESANM